MRLTLTDAALAAVAVAGCLAATAPVWLPAVERVAAPLVLPLVREKVIECVLRGHPSVALALPALELRCVDAAGEVVR